MTSRITFEQHPHPSPRPLADRDAVLAAPGFGRHFTDHMVTIDWSTEHGWHNARLEPYAPFAMDPANMTLHYGQAIFEGLKAYAQPDSTAALFRPEANARRFQRSARRLAMPELPVDTFIEACELLVRHDQAWVPQGAEQALYLRPFMFAAENTLGVRPAAAYRFMVIATPAGAYFPGGAKPVSVWVSEQYVRAAPGGTGAAKCAGNYAASLIAQAEAADHGCDQVVWLDARERRWIEEVGVMNLCFVYGSGDDATIVTPQLADTLLAGVTRDSLLTIADELGYRTCETRISLQDWRSGCANGSISEVFACGTAAVITPVGQAKTAGAGWTVGDGRPGPVSLRLREALLRRQTGLDADLHGWLRPCV
ncbi:branched-chain amino acid aminotransferase [Streptomyces sp. AgN23]|uniref:branched-chain amino acid aminotransferase n=1 Tax=Streptomyces sp. AgN23 TaxID=1188315 RepID=UPI001B31D83D|nr:branched-chain amino acid aminotransferase [Streptomyces sp. AgN23]QTI87251.1 branched-chain amino acid aminotransferase [Streptomyces sp. AgN23]